MKKYLLFIFILFSFSPTFGQVLFNPKPQATADFVSLVEKAHNAKAFLKHKAVAFDIEVSFNGKTALKGTMTTQTNSGKIKLDLGKGLVVYFDGKDVFLTPSAADYKRARFDILTWQYFFCAPFKLRDNGVNIKADIDRLNDGRAYPTAKMTFGAGIGDSPNDWYILYRNAQTNQLDGMAYIVTFGGKKADGQTPNAITYKEWTTLDGVPFPAKWQFTDWQEAKGFTKVRGEATIRNVRWVENTEGVFVVPSDSKKMDK
jgi:hypothetical protein